MANTREKRHKPIACFITSVSSNPRDLPFNKALDLLSFSAIYTFLLLPAPARHRFLHFTFLTIPFMADLCARVFSAIEKPSTDIMTREIAFASPSDVNSATECKDGFLGAITL